jgi:Uma2 family endonuclease
MRSSHKKYELPPRTGLEVFEMLPQGTLAELINDTIFMSPSPNFEHQQIIIKLILNVGSFTEKNDLGLFLTAPMDVYLDNKNVVQPDILFISKNGQAFIGDNGKVNGAPDLIIEVLSSGNKKHDTDTKKSMYEKFGVREYFIVDPVTKEVTAFILTNKKFVKQAITKATIKSKLLKKNFTF